MTYCTLFVSLAILALGFGAYFAYHTTREEDKKFEGMEFLKILGLFVLCGLVFGIFVDIFFLIARFLLWFLIHVSGFLKTQLLARKTGAILSLLAINAMGAYLFWEMRKEDREREESDFSFAEEKISPSGEPEAETSPSDSTAGDREEPSGETQETAQTENEPVADSGDREDHSDSESKEEDPRE